MSPTSSRSLDDARLRGPATLPYALHVDALGHRFEVVRIDTGRNAAEMIDLQSFSNRTDEQPVGIAVSRAILDVWANKKAPIPALAFVPLPQPAWPKGRVKRRHWPVFLDQSPKALLRSLVGIVCRVAIHPTPPVVHLAKGMRLRTLAAAWNGTDRGLALADRFISLDSPRKPQSVVMDLAEAAREMRTMATLDRTPNDGLALGHRAAGAGRPLAVVVESAEALREDRLPATSYSTVADDGSGDGRAAAAALCPLVVWVGTLSLHLKLILSGVTGQAVSAALPSHFTRLAAAP